jgi:hypothetical protein
VLCPGPTSVDGLAKAQIRDAGKMVLTDPS